MGNRFSEIAQTSSAHAPRPRRAPGRSVSPAGVQPGKLARLCTRMYRTLYFRNSFRISDSIHFMHYQSEFQSDPFQDRRAARTGQEWVELETCAFVCLRETFFPARW